MALVQLPVDFPEVFDRIGSRKVIKLQYSDKTYQLAGRIGIGGQSLKFICLFNPRRDCSPLTTRGDSINVDGSEEYDIVLKVMRHYPVLVDQECEFTFELRVADKIPQPTAY